MLRFRPILMTTMCAMLGGVPLMIGTGTGSEIASAARLRDRRRPPFSQLLTLFTTPVVYLYLDRLGGWLSRLRSRSADIQTETRV